MTEYKNISNDEYQVISSTEKYLRHNYDTYKARVIYSALARIFIVLAVWAMAIAHINSLSFLFGYFAFVSVFVVTCLEYEDGRRKIRQAKLLDKYSDLL
ncbi:MAG TPA: hypothetical protein ENJ84_06955 [Gammaproteobacteria bacterium]|nr:hypothetical protein [Gammaproteobacteria bacterium]